MDAGRYCGDCWKTHDGAPGWHHFLGCVPGPPIVVDSRMLDRLRYSAAKKRSRSTAMAELTLKPPSHERATQPRPDRSDQMGKVLSAEEADQIVPRATRKRVSKEARIEARENEALEELRAMGFRVTLHDLPKVVEGDELLGTQPRILPGNCYAVMYSVDGKRKHVAGISAVDALTQARVWWDFQKGLKDDAPSRFIPAAEFTPEARVRQLVAGDTRETQTRRENTARRRLSLDGTPHLVDAHGDPA